MIKWEYLVETWTLSINTADREEFEQELNEYGRDGWELVTIIPNAGDSNDSISIACNQLVFKRKVE
ncbi:DUF4177 domain-containing protein [Ornithinibacillus bavariensis]|uniref:DUF4177 domain-containing protein n=1 Tax=Ornithinibacillus bavariensis TaxID=545502 RepID=UPI003D206B67